jgi:DNA-binding transcriptional LysR family regulator
MNIYFLKYFCDAIRFKSITQAAKENHVTKSAVSQGITQLEKTLGAPLLTHQRNRIKTTPQGDILYRLSRSIFQQIDALQLSLQSSLHEYEGSLTIGCSHSLGLSLLPKLLQLFRKKAPKVDVQVLFGHTGNIKEWLVRSQVEIGLVLDNDDLSAFILEPVYKGKFLLFESVKRNPKEPLTSCIFPPARVEVFQIKKAFLQKYGYELETDMEIGSWEAISNLIIANNCVGVLPDYMLTNLAKAKFLRKSKANISVPYTMHIASTEPLSKNAKLFAKLLKEQF